MPDYDAVVRQMKAANLNEYETDAVLRFIGFVQNRDQKGQLIAHRVDKWGLIEMEFRSYLGRKQFMGNKT